MYIAMSKGGLNMDKMTYDCSLNLAQDVIFGSGGKVTDALILLNWLDSYKPTKPLKKVIGKQTVYFCLGCRNVVCKGDWFCSKCGRGFVW